MTDLAHVSCGACDAPIYLCGARRESDEVVAADWNEPLGDFELCALCFIRSRHACPRCHAIIAVHLPPMTKGEPMNLYRQNIDRMLASTDPKDRSHWALMAIRTAKSPQERRYAEHQYNKAQEDLARALKPRQRYGWPMWVSAAVGVFVITVILGLFLNWWLS